MLWPGKVLYGKAGKVRQSMARQCKARHGLARKGRRGNARLGGTKRGVARCGLVWQARQDEVSSGTVCHDKSGCGLDKSFEEELP